MIIANPGKISIIRVVQRASPFETFMYTFEKKYWASQKILFVTTNRAVNPGREPSPMWAVSVDAGKLNKRETGAGAVGMTGGSVYQPCVYSVLCGTLADGVDVVEREQHHGSARNQCVWHSKALTPVIPCLQ